LRITYYHTKRFTYVHPFLRAIFKWNENNGNNKQLLLLNNSIMGDNRKTVSNLSCIFMQEEVSDRIRKSTFQLHERFVRIIQLYQGIQDPNANNTSSIFYGVATISSQPQHC
jgi:hypothetical protein